MGRVKEQLIEIGFQTQYAQVNPYATVSAPSTVQSSIGESEMRPKNDSGSAKIAIPSANGYEFIPIIDITRCEAAAKYTLIYYDETEVVSTKNIRHFVDILSEYGFFPCHKSHLVNLRFVRSYTRDGEIVLNNGVVVPLSRRRKGAFLRLFK